MADLPFRDAYIFGGTLDPIHEGHVGVLREVYAPGRVLVVAPTLQNPWKEEQPTPLAMRRQMIGLVLACEKFTLRPPVPEEGVCVSDIDYVYVADFVHQWRKRFSGPIHWVVGPDIAETATQWKDWDLLNIALYTARSYADDLHAKEIRAGEAVAHPALREFIREHGLYRG